MEDMDGAEVGLLSACPLQPVDRAGRRGRSVTLVVGSDSKLEDILIGVEQVIGLPPGARVRFEYKGEVCVPSRALFVAAARAGEPLLVHTGMGAAEREGPRILLLALFAMAFAGASAMKAAEAEGVELGSGIVGLVAAMVALVAWLAWTVLGGEEPPPPDPGLPFAPARVAGLQGAPPPPPGRGRGGGRGGRGAAAALAAGLLWVAGGVGWLAVVVVGRTAMGLAMGLAVWIRILLQGR